MADICVLYLNKFVCIRDNYCHYNSIKEKHCILMYEKLLNLCGTYENKKNDN